MLPKLAIDLFRSEQHAQHASTTNTVFISRSALGFGESVISFPVGVRITLNRRMIGIADQHHPGETVAQRTSPPPARTNAQLPRGD